MTFPALQEVTETSIPTASTTHEIQMPASVDSGDLLILMVSLFQFGLDFTSIATPSGWTEKWNFIETRSSTNNGLACFVRAADGSEGGTTVDVGTDFAVPAAAQVRRYKGWSGDVADLEFQLGPYSVTQTPDPPSLTYSGGADDNLFLEGVHAFDDDATTSSYSSGYANGADVVSGGGGDNGPSIHCAELAYSATATQNPGTHTLSQGEGTYPFTLVIPPAAGGVVVTVGAGFLTAGGGDLAGSLAAALAAGALPAFGQALRSELIAEIEAGHLAVAGQALTLDTAEEIAAGIVDLAGTDIAISQGLTEQIAARVLQLRGWDIHIAGVAHELDSATRAITRAVVRAVARVLTHRPG